MNEVCRECLAGVTQAREMDLAWRCMKHGVVRLSDYEATHRTFSAEDVERATDALNDICVPGNTATIRELARAALAAIGTVEEVE